MKSKQRLHPLVILVLLGKFLKIWIVPIILLIPGLNSVAKLIHFNVWWLVAILIVVVLLFTVLDYLTFSFEIGSASLTIHSGILIKKHTHIPYDRIQSIEHNQWFFFLNHFTLNN
ncbi:PH domain-containing protein [Secundilactobacillus oryzae]|uniref:PH domain-containing protein n=1 Tax=Secundilactobacillus oryzae TaxID=1202668 RepID=UPI0006CF53FE|nr:PH domain-containing protein [Secundilactobacillus oryzae]